MSKKRVQLFIDKLKKVIGQKGEGNASGYLLVMIAIIGVLLLYKFAINDERIHVTYYAVDDALVSSLIAASTINTSEYGRSGQIIIYDDVTSDSDYLGGTGLTEEEKAQDMLTDINLFSPTADYYLNRAYNAFVNSLKVNLQLDSTMHATIAGIDGLVDVEEFSVYNRYEYYDSTTGALLHYRYIKYSFNGSTWSVEPYDIDRPVAVYNSFDKVSTALDTTTITARLKFRFKVNDDMPLFGITGKAKEVSYQRLVDVTN